MSKAFYISGIVLSIAFMVVVFYYVEACSHARMEASIDSFKAQLEHQHSAMGSGYNSDSFFQYSAVLVTMEGATATMPFILIFIVIYILGLIKVKTKTILVMSTIGLTVSGIFLLWNWFMLAEPANLSFDEVGLAFIPFGLITLAFFIVGLVQNIRFRNGKMDFGNARKDLLDS